MTSGERDAAADAGKPRPRVLVVDDDPQTQIVMVAFAEHLGYLADAVSGGAEAVERLRAGRHGIVLLDCRMPGIDGFEATRRIRALDLPGPPPVILGFSGEDRLDLRVECMAAGMDGFLPKPFTAEEFRGALERGR